MKEQRPTPLIGARALKILLAGALLVCIALTTGIILIAAEKTGHEHLPRFIWAAGIIAGITVFLAARAELRQ